MLLEDPPWYVQLTGPRQTKIALRCDSEDEMLLLQAQAQSLNICARSIQDA